MVLQCRNLQCYNFHMNISRPSDLLDRVREWSILSRVLGSDDPELVIATGRRRVGKSYLLARFSQAACGIYYQATRRTEAAQVRALSRAAGERFDDPVLQEGAPFADWEGLFRYLVRRAGEEPLLLVLDEFPYLCEASPALPSILQALFDHELQRTKLKIVLSGSHISAMRRLEAADQPLFARRTARIQVAPFSHEQVAAFAPAMGPLDLLRTWGVFGGLPGHLALLDPDLGLAANVARKVLDSSSRLFDEAEHMLDGFLGDAEVHYSILGAIAAGQRTWSGITGRLGRSSGSLSRPMNWLIDMQVVQRVAPVTRSQPARSKQAIYRIVDPYVRFWHRFVAPLVSSGASAWMTPEELFEARVAPRLDDFMGPVFEEVCRAFVRRGRGLPFTPSRVGEWWSGRSDAQIDVVATADDGELLVGECKWGTVDRHDLDRLRAHAIELQQQTGGGPRVHHVLFAGRGTEDPRLLADAQDGAVRLIGPDELLRSI